MGLSRIATILGVLIALGNLVIADSADIAALIAKRMSWPLSAGVVRRATLDQLHGCEVYDAWDRRVLDGQSVAVARLSDGALIARSDPRALDMVFTHCISTSTSAATLAELVARFTPNPGPLVVLHDDSRLVARMLLCESGQKFTPPEAVKEQNVLQVRFLGLAEDGAALYHLEARATADAVTVQAKRLAAGTGRHCDGGDR
jgi:hypothetical protein